MTERFESRGDADFGVLFAVQQLQVLNGVFNVDDSAGAVLHIHIARFHQFRHLSAAQVKSVLPIPGLAAERETIAMRFDASSEFFIAGTPSQFYQCLPLEWRCFAANAVVLHELI